MSLFFGKTAEDEMNEMVDEKMGNGMDRPVDDMGTARDNHYDGSSMDDVFENYDDARKGNLYVPIHFVETRKYLQQVRDLKRAIELLENRISYRTDAGMDTSEQEAELEGLKTQLKQIIAEVADEISKVGDINQEIVLTKRYIDVMSWEEVAMSADLKMYTIHRCHGKALPKMEEILLEDGLIILEEDGVEDEYGS